MSQHPRACADRHITAIRIQLALSIAIPACTLVINRRLYKIASIRTVMVTRGDKRREMLIDSLIGVGLPLLSVALYYIHQGHRYDIYQELGCVAPVYLTWASMCLLIIWPLVIGVISAVYTGLVLWTFMKRRAQFNRLVESNPSLTMSRYWRLMALSSTELLFTLPMSAWIVAANFKLGINDWVSWADVHSDWNRVDQYASVIWRIDPTLVQGRELNRWAYVVAAVIFFSFFGFAAEARKNYTSALSAISSFTLRKSGSSGSAASKTLNGSNATSSKVGMSGGSLPVFIKKHVAVSTDKPHTLRGVKADASFTSTLSIPEINSYGEFDVDDEKYDEKYDGKLNSPSNDTASTISAASPISPIESSAFSPTDTFAGHSFGDKSSRPASSISEDAHGARRGSAPVLPSDMV
jgi:pheromone a factor receptor